ncbi:hypothetical protein K438DRAFT_490771 [Mycena galopus ATCC 62051]|nr:hypothetical protein K438DRAFT_490771 [Mycena galopus ATCC 62051]
MFLSRPALQAFELTYIHIVARLIRALWSLEAAHANASDVFVFWLAIAVTSRILSINQNRRPGLHRRSRESLPYSQRAVCRVFQERDIFHNVCSRSPLSDKGLHQIYHLIAAQGKKPQQIRPAADDPTNASRISLRTCYAR